MHSIKHEIEVEDPSLIFVHIPYRSEEDVCFPVTHRRLKTIIDEDMSMGRACIIADTRHTKRWNFPKQITPTLCRGDLTFIATTRRSPTNLSIGRRNVKMGIPDAPMICWNLSSQIF